MTSLGQAPITAAAAALRVMPEIVRQVVEQVEQVVEEMVLLPRVIQQPQAVDQQTQVAVEVEQLA
jgi:hypothetical protein